MHNSKKTHCINGHKFTPDNIYKRYDSNGRRCKECEKQRMRNYMKNSGKLDNNKAKYHEEKWKLFNQILDHYGHKCNCPKCLETNMKLLTVDHINNDGAKHRRDLGKGNKTINLYRYIIENNFPSEFQILCHNCNWGRSRYGICPHQS